MRRSTRSPRGTPDPLSGTDVLQTVGDWLRFCVSLFSRSTLAHVQGLHGPQEEAMFLVGRFIGLSQEDLPHFLSARLTRRECLDLRALVRRRVVDHVPVSYLVTEAPLGGLSFFVDERVLIPRSYVAELIPDAVCQFGGRDWNPRRILEIGTGCGCLAILAARSFPNALVDAVDIDPPALEVAQLNVEAHALEDRVHLLTSDVFNGIPRERYDLIIANPPYEPSALLENQPDEIAHEPRLALDGGDDGMDCIQRIVTGARRHLSRSGILVLELGGLRLELCNAYPNLRHHVFPLHDGSDSVLGFRARHLPAAKARV